MPPVLRPTALRLGDTVAVAALSGPMEDAGLLARGIATIERMGFVVEVSPLVHRGPGWWWAAARPQEIAEEFNRLLRDPRVRAVFALSGGRTTLGYLDRIDYDAVHVDPKPVIGFSDIDAIHLALHARTGLVSVHGDLVMAGFGVWDDLEPGLRRRLEQAYLGVLTSVEPVGDLPAVARLVAVQATPFALPPERFDGAVLFVEALGASSTAWNDLQVLRVAGVLDRVAGLIVGPSSTLDYGDEGPRAFREIVLDVLGDRDLPVLGEVDIGHAPPDVPLPIGVRAELDADARRIALLEAAVVHR